MGRPIYSTAAPFAQQLIEQTGLAHRVNVYTTYKLSANFQISVICEFTEYEFMYEHGIADSKITQISFIYR